jgi:hypothetical protein
MTKLNPNDLAIYTLLAIVISGTGSAGAQTATGSVSGRLMTESGQPLPGATAVYRKDMKYVADGHYHLVPALGERAVTATVTTHPDGTFTAANLPVGNYSLCLDSPPDGYIDHCDWNLDGAHFTVVAGTNTVMKPVTIISGVRIHFMISDPQGALPTTAKIEPTATIGVVTPRGAYRPAAVKSRSGAVTELVVTVPHTQPVSTSIFSRTLKFSDSLGSPATLTSINPPPGATDHQINLTVTK